MEIDGRYRLEDRIGSGGTGEVWRAVDERLNRVVAIKLLHPWVAQAAEGRERFRREAAAMGRLRHPHIVQVLDFNDTAERPFLVQEHCPGGTLSALLGGGRLPWDRVRALARPIAEALAHAHGQGVIHRDLKPSNVLFAEGGRVVVGDFGLARLLATSDGTLTATGMRMGSPEYWSPEQAAGDPVSERADVYALGCILYHLVSGGLPFPGEDRLAAGYRRVHEDAAPLGDEAGALIERLMEREPSRRPLAEDVVALLEGRPSFDATHVAAPPPADETVRLLAQTMVAPPVAAPRPVVAPLREPEPVVIPAGNEPVAPRQYPGVRSGGAVGAILVGAAAFGVAAAAGEASAAVDVDRSGLLFRSELASDDAIAALAILGAAAVLTLSLVLLAIWSARQSGRARLAFVRGLLGFVAIVVSCMAAGALVWTANAGTTAGISKLLTDAGL
ncbi:MAG: eukaryotic-like serine/threonine-protein kinase [Gaiellaceae bacterium]|nr:eukaryotic-like serine/threonine-protein kinase [Gaiellaceae bacterium]